jgi:hypothetical protein
LRTASVENSNTLSVSRRILPGEMAQGGEQDRWMDCTTSWKTPRGITMKVDGVRLSTLADRGAPSIAESSPTTSPGRMSRKLTWRPDSE